MYIHINKRTKSTQATSKITAGMTFLWYNTAIQKPSLAPGQNEGGYNEYDIEYLLLGVHPLHKLRLNYITVFCVFLIIKLTS